MWLKGNLHTHTNQTDGDAPPQTVVGWYAARGYDFLSITDHNTITLAESEQLLLMRGVEITLSAERKPVHVNALDIGAEFSLSSLSGGGASIVQTLQHAVDATNAAGGTAMINHPNYQWAFRPDELARVRDWSLLELYNPSTYCNNFGYGGRMGVEAMWDTLLSTGQRVYAVAADDSHDFLKERWGDVSAPGLAWVQVWAAERSLAALRRALGAGDFYATTEIELDELVLGDAELRLRIRPIQDYVYTTFFIGKEGRVLSVMHGGEARYTVRGDEGYVRAKVFSSNGGWAWTQPIHL